MFWRLSNTGRLTLHMNLRFALAVSAVIACTSLVQSAEPYASKIEDLARVSGAQEGSLSGVGLVSGLANDGDKNGVATLQAYKNALEAHGISVPAGQLSSKNVALVTVTAKIPAFKKIGDRIDVEVAAAGDAKSLQGGSLLRTVLIGVDGEVYALAQGSLAVGGFSVGSGGGGGANVTKNFPTAGTISAGGEVVREIPVTMVRDDHVVLNLRQANWITASRMADKINAKFPGSSRAEDAATIKVRVPVAYLSVPVEFIAQLSSIEVVPDIPAKIVINEKMGTIAASGNVKISSVLIAQGALSVAIAQNQNVTPAGSFTPGQSTTTTNTTVNVTESEGKFVALPEMPTLEDIAALLKRLGAPPRDIMAIIIAMHAAGAIRAELEIK